MSVGQAVAHLESAQLVRQLAEEEQTYLFKHALVQDTVYTSLLKQDRKRLHRVIASRIEMLYPQQRNENAALLAEHYWVAEEWSHAAEYLLQAGTQALRVYAVREALGYFERLLAALGHDPAPPPLMRYEAEMGWAEAAAKQRPYAEQLEHLTQAEQLARELDDKPRLARALYSIGGVQTASGHNMRAVAPLAECFTLAQELGEERLTVIPTYFMGMATLDADTRAALGLFDRAIELAERYENYDVEAIAYSTKAWAHARLGEFANARRAVAQGQALLARVKSPMAASDVDLFAGWSYYDMGDAERGLLYGQRGADKATAALNMDCVCGAYLCVGFNQLLAQHLSQATDAFHEAVRQSRYSGAGGFENLAQVGLAFADAYSGNDQAISALERAHNSARTMQDELGMAMIAQGLGELYSRRGDAQRAEEWLTRALLYFRRQQMTPSLARTLEILANVYAAQGREREEVDARREAMLYQDALAQEKQLA